MFTARGCYTAIVTPFSADGTSVDLERLAEHVRFQAEAGVSGVVPCGTTGESPTLTEREQHAVIERVIATGRPLGLQVIAGTGSNSTAHAVHLHTAAAKLGADASLQVNPYYNKPSQEGLYRHFMAVADSADLPIMLYNIPGRCGVALTPATVERLGKHPNIRAIKEATGSLDSASEIVSRCDIALISGDDTMTLPFASVGGVGVVSVVSNILPGEVQAMCLAFLEDNWTKARQLHHELFPLCKALLSLDTNPVPIKAAMEILGRDRGSLRLPMVRAAEPVLAQVRALVEENALLEQRAVTAPGLPYKLAVLCYLYDHEGRVLLLHRLKDPNAGMCSPIGGKLETSLGEGPHECALREIREEAGITLPDEAIRLTGMVSERAYPSGADPAKAGSTGGGGHTHWLIFLFEVMRPIGHDEIASYDMNEGRLEWVAIADVPSLDIPETDRRVMWPSVQRHRGGFFSVHIDCSVEPFTWRITESWLAGTSLSAP